MLEDCGAILRQVPQMLLHDEKQRHLRVTLDVGLCSSEVIAYNTRNGGFIRVHYAGWFTRTYAGTAGLYLHEPATQVGSSRAYAVA